MKKVFILVCAAIFSAIILTSCTQSAKNDMKKDVTEVMNGAETLASEVKDNINDMIENGTVNDGDGILNEDKTEYKDHTDSIYDTTDGISTDRGNISEDESVIADENESAESDSFI